MDNKAKQTFEDVPGYLRDYLTYSLTIAGMSVKTVNAYYYELKMMLRYFKRHFGLVSQEVPFEEIDVSDLPIDVIRDITLGNMYEFLAYVNLSRGNIARTRARKVSCIRSFYKYLETKANLIMENPVKNLDLPKIGATVPRYLDLDSSIKLLKSIDNTRDYAMIIILLNCGLRVSELTAINIKDIRGDTLVVTGKGNKERTVYLNEACVNALDAYNAGRKTVGSAEKDALFLNHRNARIGARGVELIVKKYLALAGLDAEKYSVHKLRHTAATLMYRHAGVDLRTLQEILGHSSLQTTQIYTHVDDRQKREAAKSNPLASFNKFSE